MMKLSKRWLRVAAMVMAVVLVAGMFAGCAGRQSDDGLRTVRVSEVLQLSRY